MKATGIQGKYLEYKGQPLVRVEDDIYYGDMSEKYYLFMMIMSYKEIAKFNTQVPDMIMVQIVSTTNAQDVKKQKIVNGLYEAFDLGTAWLERENRV